MGKCREPGWEGPAAALADLAPQPTSLGPLGLTEEPLDPKLGLRAAYYAPIPNDQAPKTPHSRDPMVCSMSTCKYSTHHTLHGCIWHETT